MDMYLICPAKGLERDVGGHRGKWGGELMHQDTAASRTACIRQISTFGSCVLNRAHPNDKVKGDKGEEKMELGGWYKPSMMDSKDSCAKIPLQKALQSRAGPLTFEAAGQLGTAATYTYDGAPATNPSGHAPSDP